MNKIGIIINLEKPEILKITSQIVEWLQAVGKRCWLLRLVFVLQRGWFCAGGIISSSEKELAEEAECVVVLGGDGTLLNSARTIGVLGKPILG